MTNAFAKQRPALKDHIQASHTQKRSFKCTVEGCGKTFSRKKGTPKSQQSARSR